MTAHGEARLQWRLHEVAAARGFSRLAARHKQIAQAIEAGK